ncbi:MAG TPA: hypothetical protein VIL85_01510, partial [Thermomicrobiales bacterium]
RCKLLEQAVVEGECGGIRLTVRFNLLVDVGDVALGGANTEVESGGDLAVAEPRGDQGNTSISRTVSPAGGGPPCVVGEDTTSLGIGAACAASAPGRGTIVPKNYSGRFSSLSNPDDMTRYCHAKARNCYYLLRHLGMYPGHDRYCTHTRSRLQRHRFGIAYSME